MRFVLTSEDFVYAMRARPGFPLILDDDMVPAEPLHSYLMWRLLGKGAALDQKTWEAYGRAIWDFARFLQANQLTWNQPFDSPGEGVVAMYRDWQVMDLKLQAVTINKRLRQNGTYFGPSAIEDARKRLMARSEEADPGSIGWLVTKHPNHLSEGQPAWIVKREAICINAAAVSRGARDRPKRWSSSTC